MEEKKFEQIAGETAANVSNIVAARDLARETCGAVTTRESTKEFSSRAFVRSFVRFRAGRCSERYSSLEKSRLVNNYCKEEK